MKKLLLTLVFGILGVGVYGQTIKSLGYNTTNGRVVYSGTNTLTFTNAFSIRDAASGSNLDFVFTDEALIAGYGDSDYAIGVGGYGVAIKYGAANSDWGQPILFQEGSGNVIFPSATLEFIQPLAWSSVTNAATTRTNLGLGLPALTNTNVTNFRSAIELGETNNVTFNQISINDVFTNNSFIDVGNSVMLSRDTDNNDGLTVYFTGSRRVYVGNAGVNIYLGSLRFSNNAVGASQTRTNLGLGWSALTNTNAANFRTAIELGTTNDVTFNSLAVSNTALTRTNLELGATNSVEFARITANASESSSFLRIGTNLTGFWVGPSFNSVQLRVGGSNAWIADTNRIEYTIPALYQAGLRNNGDLTNNNGTIYGFKTNVGPFEGIGNFFASNNTTVSNETLFRVGLAEQNDKSAQFGFRVARTNNGGEGFAVFSVFGYNALMMIGPSDRSRSNSITNTNAGIEADIWSISPTNKVMTLITTNTGAMQMHRPIGFNTNASAPANTTNVVGWIEMYVGTNSVRIPYYQ
jgi:hypothetical protein